MSDEIGMMEAELADAVDAAERWGSVLVAHPDGTFQCEPCARASGVDLEAAQTFEVGSDGWTAPVVCRSCRLSIPVYVDGAP